MKLTSLKPGDTVYRVHAGRLGNTTCKTVSIVAVRVIDVDPDLGLLRVEIQGCQRSLMGHQAEKFAANCRKKRPETVTSITGAVRLKRKTDA